MHGGIAPKWEGPYEVVGLTTSTAHLRKDGGGEIKGVSYDLLKMQRTIHKWARVRLAVV